MKRLLGLVICIAMLSAALFTACGGTKQSGPSGATAGPAEQKKEPVPAAKAQTEPVKVLQDEVSADGADATGNDIVKAYIEEKSGVKFEMTQLKSEQELMTKINLTLASNDKVDIIRVSNPAFLWDLQSRGALMKLNDLLDKYGQNVKKQFPEDTWKATTDKNGVIWCVPRSQDNMGNLLYIRKDWREKLGIKNTPSTLEEFENFIKAVKDKDLDGNGTNDTIPFLTFRGISDLDWTLLYAFCETSGDYKGNYIDDSGKVTPIVLHPQYREYLKKMSEWYKAGLLFPEIYNIKRDRVNDLMIANRMAAGGGWYSDPTRPWETLMKKVPDAFYEFFSLKTLKGNAPKVTRNPRGSPGVAIVSYSKNAEFAMKLIDWTVASNTNYVTTRAGKPEVHWTWANESKMEINDLKEPGKNIYNTGFGITENNKFATKTVNRDAGFVRNKYDELKVLMEKIGYIYVPDWFVPYQWKGTPVESSLQDSQTMIDEAKTQIIIGQKPLEEWDRVIAQYRRMHADKYIELATKQYNEFNKK